MKDKEQQLHAYRNQNLSTFIHFIDEEFVCAFVRDKICGGSVKKDMTVGSVKDFRGKTQTTLWFQTGRRGSCYQTVVCGNMFTGHELRGQVPGGR